MRWRMGIKIMIDADILEKVGKVIQDANGKKYKVESIVGHYEVVGESGIVISMPIAVVKDMEVVEG